VVRTAVGLVAGTPYTRTEAQKAAILFLLKDLKKECPCLDVASDPDYRQLNLD